ncbi:MAG: sugar phosphate isomerase/epimerase [Clostridia bacterium]|nr:sugar phosphate isomerase/epimerase [Clostridia bacterium]
MKRYKRAFSTLTCMGADLDETLMYAQKANIRALEIRLEKDDTVCGYGIDRAEEVKTKFAAAGCVIVDLATSVGVADKNDKALERAERCIDLAAALGAKAIRIFAGGSIKTFDEVPVQNFDGIAVTLREMCAYAKAKNVEVWAETHNALSTAKSICRLCDLVGDDNLKVLWDVVHSIEFHEPVEESVKIIGDRLSHIHIKDAVRQEDKTLTQYRHTALGEGDMPLGKVLSLLDAADYDGYISLEWELPWRPELAGCYPDADATLAAFNRWMDEAEQA